MERAVILGAARTPFGKFSGALSPLSAPELGGAAIRASIERSGVEEGEIQHSMFGIVVQAGVGQIPSRQANFHAGLPYSLTTETLNQVCASGIRSATLLETMIRAGDYEVVLAGGMESMSNAPYLLPKARWGARTGDGAMVDAMMHETASWTPSSTSTWSASAPTEPAGLASPARGRTSGAFAATSAPPQLLMPDASPKRW